MQHSETVVKINGSAMYRKMTILLNGDKEYQLYSYLAEDMLNDKNSQLFFSRQNFSSVAAPSIFENKNELPAVKFKEYRQCDKGRCNGCPEKYFF
jgi:hypothetical protein